MNVSQCDKYLRFYLMSKMESHFYQYIKLGGDVNRKIPFNDEKAPLIVLAGLWQQADVLKFLLSKGVCPNSTDDKGRTALSYLTYLNSYYPLTPKNAACIEILMAAGADISLTDGSGRSIKECILSKEVPREYGDIVLRCLSKKEAVNALNEQAFEPVPKRSLSL